MRRAHWPQAEKLQAARATSEHSNVQRLEELTHAFAKVQDATGLGNPNCIMSCKVAMYIPCSQMPGTNCAVCEIPCCCANAGMKDMAELADALAAVQDHSFSLFGFVGELNLEVERLEERAAHAADELEHSRAASSQTQAQRARQIQVHFSCANDGKER